MSEKSSSAAAAAELEESATMSVIPDNAGRPVNLSLPVMSFNLHRDRAEDGPNSWEHRRELCVNLINKFSPLVVCTQEGLKSQLEDLATALPGYEQFGMSRKGPSDPNEEHCAILFAADKVEKMDGGTFWLSESPEVPDSNSWKAENPCIATFIAEREDIAIDDISRARRRGALLIWQHIATLPPSLPVIFCGTFETVKESTAGRFLLGRTRTWRVPMINSFLFSQLMEHGVAGDLRDGWAAARQRRNGGIVHTQHGFKGESRSAKEILKLVFLALCLCWDRQNQDLHVDWILFRGRSLTPVYSEIVDYNVDGRYPSDHYPVYVEFGLPRSVVMTEELNRVISS
ncbi:unnamed protein product [Calypogeia fissa]